MATQSALHRVPPGGAGAAAPLPGLPGAGPPTLPGRARLRPQAGPGRGAHGVDPGTIAAHYTLGRKRLVPKAALDPITTIVRQARYALEGLSHALPDGSRF